SWLDAYRQIKGYEEKAPELFKYVQFSIATDGDQTYYFPNAFNEEEKDLLSIWKDPYPYRREEFKDDILKTTIYGMLSKQNILDIITNFIFIRKERDKTTKIMSRYMQYRATNKICERIINTLRGKEEKKFGLIWHWQGSGKTYTMAFSSWKLLHSPETRSPSIFVMVDRKELEEQIEKDFGFIEIPIEKIQSVNELIEILKWGREGKRGIFLVTIEKFRPKEFEQLEKMGEKIEIGRENVIVLADEVHRTHYGKFSTMMRSIFRNAFIFGFTGTPLSKVERNTFQKFCPEGEAYLDRYTMLDALDDGFTIPLSYQPRLPEYHIDRQQREEFLRFEEEEIRPLTEMEQRELRRKIRVIKAFLKKPERIKAIARDISEHLGNIVQETGLKAMVVTVDREACIQYKQALDGFLPPEQSEIVMSIDPKDIKEIREYFYKLQEKYETSDIKEIHRRIVEDFKSKSNPKILIVTDMLITGFDAPVLWTMYLDKPLREHRILQAIARTNRPLPNKKFGLIIDYIGMLADLEKAFEMYEATEGLRLVIRDLEGEKESFTVLLNKALEFFRGVKIEDTRESLEEALEQLTDPDKAKEYERTMKELMKTYEMLQGDPFLREYLSDYTLLVKIYIGYYKKFYKSKIDELKIDRLSKKTINLKQKTIDLDELDKTYPTIEVNEEYIQILRKITPKTTGGAIDIMSTIIHEARSHPTSPFFLNLSREVEETYRDLRTRKIKTEEAIKKLLEYANRIAGWKREEKEIGADKYPIYESLKTILPEIEKQTALSFTNNLLNNLQKKGLTFKGWQIQRDVRRRVRAEIRLLLLREFKEHRDRIDELEEGIFKSLEGLR
ncbi:MAG: HsdR family type I site-specific deoxyribonuclease, partial [Candidatus Bathyarchaeia archaeon]